MHLTIGQFSRATGLTVTALRHYDELGVLRPATVDPSTGYRGYDPAQVEHGQLVRLARRAGVALPDVPDLLVALRAGEDVAPRLRAGLADAGRDLADREQATAALLGRAPGGPAMPAPTIDVRPLWTGPVLLTSAEIVADDLPAFVADAYQRLYTAAGAGPLTFAPVGAFLRYHGVLEGEATTRVDACLAYVGSAASPHHLPARIETLDLDMPLWASVTVTGAAAAAPAILEAYDAVAGWLVEHRFALDGPAYEQAVSWSGEPGHPDNRLAVGFALR